MEYNILIETDFFNLLNAGHKNKGGNALENSYREFIKVVVDLGSTNVKQAVFALSYAETELDFHLSMPIVTTASPRHLLSHSRITAWLA